MNEKKRKPWLEAADFCTIGGVMVGLAVASLALYMGYQVGNPWSSVLAIALILGYLAYRIGRFIVCRLR